MLRVGALLRELELLRELAEAAKLEVPVLAFSGPARRGSSFDARLRWGDRPLHWPPVSAGALLVAALETLALRVPLRVLRVLLVLPLRAATRLSLVSRSHRRHFRVAAARREA